MKKGKRLLFLGVLVLFISNKSITQQLQFCREKISIEIKKSECELTGIYYFVNHGINLVEQPLFYPFIVNENLPFPSKYNVTNLKTGEILSQGKTKSGIFFCVTITANDTAIIEVRYSQQTPAKMIEYILTTAQDWGKPFAVADYEVKIPREYQLSEMEPAFDNITVNEGFKIFNTRKENFLPKKNFVVKWKGE